jgi:alkyl hydroperoxide reductase subunit F
MGEGAKAALSAFDYLIRLAPAEVAPVLEDA